MTALGLFDAALWVADEESSDGDESLAAVDEVLSHPSLLFDE